MAALNALVLLINSIFMEETLPRLKGTSRCWRPLSTWRSPHNPPPDPESPGSRLIDFTPPIHIRPVAVGASAQILVESAAQVHKADFDGPGETYQLLTRADHPGEWAASGNSSVLGSFGSFVSQIHQVSAEARRMGRFDSASSVTGLGGGWKSPAMDKGRGSVDGGLQLSDMVGNGSRGEAGHVTGPLNGDIGAPEWESHQAMGSPHGVGQPKGGVRHACGSVKGDAQPKTEINQACGSSQGTLRIVTAKGGGRRVAGAGDKVDDVAWFRQARVWHVLIGSSMLAMLWCYLDELTPIYVSAGIDKVIPLFVMRCSFPSPSFEHTCRCS